MRVVRSKNFFVAIILGMCATALAGAPKKDTGIPTEMEIKNKIIDYYSDGRYKIISLNILDIKPNDNKKELSVKADIEFELIKPYSYEKKGSKLNDLRWYFFILRNDAWTIHKTYRL